MARGRRAGTALCVKTLVFSTINHMAAGVLASADAPAARGPGCCFAARVWSAPAADEMWAEYKWRRRTVAEGRRAGGAAERERRLPVATVPPARTARRLSMAAADAAGPAHADPATPAVKMTPRRLCVAPMMDWTDRFDRYFLRQFSKHTWLYTEMVTTGAIIHGDQDRHLQFFKDEHPIALQLGGSDPDALAKCAAIAEGYGYDEINLNVGCPSERVSSGSFGACLMAEPELVRDCVAAMKAAVKVPVTVKHRIGIDDMQSYEELCHFVDTVHQGGCDTFIVHARIAILKGLSPKENREIPPLKYNFVYDLKRDFPHLEIIINGGITDLAQAQLHLKDNKVDGVMIGRSAYHEPFRILRHADRDIYGDPHALVRTRQQVFCVRVAYS
jgi:tRNA-dihydrouridine synthase A